MQVVLGMISSLWILNRDFKSSVWFFILILNCLMLMISILILKSFCGWLMILNHQIHPANHQILQVALQAAEQQLAGLEVMTTMAMERTIPVHRQLRRLQAK